MIAKFLDEVWLRDEQKRQLRAKFESWWLTVADYDRIKFALVCTQAFNRFMDVLFGEKLFSQRAFFRCSILATGLLVASLALTGLLNHQLLGIMPWASYRDSCKAVNDFADSIVGSGLATEGKLHRSDVSFSATNVPADSMASLALTGRLRRGRGPNPGCSTKDSEAQHRAVPVWLE